jgi:hypothetical protein
MLQTPFTAPWNAARGLTVSGLLFLVVPAAAAGQLAERHTLRGDAVAIHNLVGGVQVVPAADDRVEVAVLRQGPDGAALDVEAVRWGEWEALRVFYPDERIVYPAMGRFSRAEWRPGTNDPLRDLVPAGSGPVRLSGSGRGVEAHADITVYLPPGRRLAVHLAAGSVEMANGDGDLQVHTRSASVRTRQTRGGLHVAARSGSVQVEGAEGELHVETRSGGIVVDRARGARMRLAARSGAIRGSDLSFDEAGVGTRSGTVRLDGVRAERIEVGSRSGSVRAEDLRAEDVSATSRSGRIGIARLAARTLQVDSRSGAVELDVSAPFRTGRIRTRSGRVTAHVASGLGVDLDLRSGGRIQVDLPALGVERSRDRFTGRLGPGGAPLEIRTRSGAIRLLER